MEFFTVLPMWNYSGKQIEIVDSNSVQVGFIQRKYKNLRDKIVHYSPLTISFLETVNVDGENKDHHLKIREQSFKSTLTKMKWDLFLKDSTKESKYFLEDKTKISTNPRMTYHKNNKEYVFKRDIFNQTYEISLNDKICATISVDKRIPLTLRTVTKTNDLTIIELLGIYYVICLVY